MTFSFLIVLSAEDMDRSCRLACQDQTVQHRFYIVNGEVGWFPFGTDCARGDPDRRAFCLSGKCLVNILYDKKIYVWNIILYYNILDVF